MIKVETKIGSIFLEDKDDREEVDRIKIFDSTKKYFDYIPLDGNEEWKSLDDIYADAIDELSQIDSITKLMGCIGITSWTSSVDWEDVLEDMLGLDGCEYKDDKIINRFDESEITMDVVRNKDCVNIVGKNYIFVTDEQ